MIIFRADANEIIGSGHIMRCLSIAKAFIDMGQDVIFVTANHKSESIINSYGFKCICLNSDWRNLEAEGICDVIAEYSPELFIVDSYYVTNKYLSKLSSMVKTAYIDDLNSEIWDVDFLINYNIFADIMDYSGYHNKRTRLLLGTKYVPLRAEFINMPMHRNKSVTDILVSAGGSDPLAITEKIMRFICTEWMDIRFHIIVGGLNPRIDTIREIQSSNIILHINEKNMSELMRKCDIAISAAGSTLYELCACGTPSITYVLADNQIMAAEEFDSKGLMINAGDCRKDEVFIGTLKKCLEELINDSDKRARLSERMVSLVDGKGAERIVRCLKDISFS